MAIVSGVNIPDNKRVEISLTRIYGIGRWQAKDVANKARRRGQSSGLRPDRGRAYTHTRDRRPRKAGRGRSSTRGHQQYTPSH